MSTERTSLFKANQTMPVKTAKSKAVVMLIPDATSMNLETIAIILQFIRTFSSHVIKRASAGKRAMGNERENGTYSFL
jgi:hypothetical protein